MIALAGGSTPRRLYETLASAKFRDRVPWERLELFFGDERSVAPDHPDSNFRMAREALEGVEVTMHRMPAQDGDASGYEQLVRKRVGSGPAGIPAFDLILLGIGTDGHTASLFPGTAALEERDRLVVMNDVPALRTRRMTFTIPLIDAARRVWIIATGGDKSPVVRRCLAGDSDFPIQRIRPNGELVWWVDEAAAAGRTA